MANLVGVRVIAYSMSPVPTMASNRKNPNTTKYAIKGLHEPPPVNSEQTNMPNGFAIKKGRIIDKASNTTPMPINTLLFTLFICRL